MLEDYLSKGIAAAKSGDEKTARIFLSKAIRAAPEDERTWGWFYTVCWNDAERIKCLSEILRINPTRAQAKMLYDKLVGVPTPEAPSQNIPSKPISVTPMQSSQQESKTNKSSNTILLLVVAIILICVCGLLYNSFSSSSGQSNQSTPSNLSNETGIYKISGSHFGCSDRDYFEKLVDYAVADDVQAFQQALVAGIYVGDCTLFDDGETVYLMDTAIFSGLVKIRRQGDIQEFWTNSEAIE